MMAETISITIPHPLNVQLWWVGLGSRTERRKCPECLGTRVVELHLANGEKYSLDCECCSRGCEGPYGFINETIHEYTPTPFTARRVRMDGEEFWYSESGPDAASYSSANADDLFQNIEQCAARCAEKTAEAAKEREEQAVRQLESKRKRLAWSVHYWRGQAKKLETDLERARARLNRCKHVEAA